MDWNNWKVYVYSSSIAVAVLFVEQEGYNHTLDIHSFVFHEMNRQRSSIRLSYLPKLCTQRAPDMNIYKLY